MIGTRSILRRSESIYDTTVRVFHLNVWDEVNTNNFIDAHNTNTATLTE